MYKKLKALTLFILSLVLIPCFLKSAGAVDPLLDTADPLLCTDSDWDDDDPATASAPLSFGKRLASESPATIPDSAQKMPRLDFFNTTPPDKIKWLTFCSIPDLGEPAVETLDSFCKQFLPSPDNSAPQTIIPFLELQKLIKKFTSMQVGFLGKEFGNQFFQKLVPTHEVDLILIGDLHGRADSLCRNLLKLEMLDNCMISQDLTLAPNCYLVLTGDYEDRGPNSIGVWYMLMHIACKNPDRVILLQGNHEECETSSDVLVKRIIAERQRDTPTLQNEIVKKYSDCGVPEAFDGNQANLLARYFISGIFYLLPSALFVGADKDFIQICHGGTMMPPNYENFDALLSSGHNFQTIYDDKSLLWSDFTIGDDLKDSERGLEAEAFTIGIDFLPEYFDIINARTGIRLHKIFRGHQHNNGAVSVKNKYIDGAWIPLENQTTIRLSEDKNLVYSLTSCPGFPAATRTEKVVIGDAEGFGIVHIVPGDYDHWTLTPYEFHVR